MQRKTPLTRVTACFMSIMLILSAIPVCSLSVFAAGADDMSVGTMLSENEIVTKNTKYNITSGVTENTIVTNNLTSSNQKIGFLCTIDTTNEYIKAAAGYANYDGSKYLLKTTTAQAADYEKVHPGSTVIAAVNADFYNMQTGQVLGALVMDGTVYSAHNGRTFFAVLKDGTPVICDGNAVVQSSGAYYGQQIDIYTQVDQAVGGDQITLRNGEFTINTGDDYATLRYSRSAIGITADGKIVTYVTHGVNSPISCGETYEDVTNKLYKAGCTSALMLDGGGSATFVSKREGEAALSVRNNPSDGSARNVSSTILFVSTAPATGEFDHVSLSPVDEYYTPGSTVAFTAVGVDAYGNKAELPTEGITWALAEGCEAMGEISAEGIFTSNGETGNITVNTVYNNEVVGSSVIHIAEPDLINFSSEKASLDFGKSSNLGLIVRVNDCDLNFDENDFTWEIKSTTAGVEDSAIGKMEGNTFIATTPDQTQEYDVDVTVTYELKNGEKLSATISVAIGRMPEILYDFEIDENGKALQAAHYGWGMTGDRKDKDGNVIGTYPGPYYLQNYEGDSLDLITGNSYNYTDSTTIDPERANYENKTQPYAFSGNFETAVPAADIFRADGYTFYMWPNASLNDRTVGSADVVNSEKGEVRFGDYALDVYYDFTSFNAQSNSNFYLRYCGDDISIDGMPTELGMWVYAPEGTATFRIAVCIETWNGSRYSTQNIFLKTQDGSDLTYTGINWTGWKYCYADLTGLWKYVDSEHPMQIKSGSGLMWINFTPKSKDINGNEVRHGDTTAGHLYFDNIRVVYGATQDDLTEPVINTITANGTEIAADGSTVLNGGSLILGTTYVDPESDNRSGIDTEKTFILVDGVKLPLNNNLDTFSNVSVNLANGTHSVRAIVADAFGNQVSETRYFTVNDEASTAPVITVTGDEKCELGKEYKLTVSASADINGIEALIKANKAFGEPAKVEFAEGVTGKYSYDNGNITVKASSEAPVSGDIAVITYNIAPATAENTKFTYGVERCTYSAGETQLSMAKDTSSVNVQAYYKIDTDIMVAGLSGNIYTYLSDGTKAANVPVYLVNGSESELLGTTDENGILSTDKLCETAGATFTIYCADENGYSFRLAKVTAATAGDNSGIPSSVNLNGASNGTSEKNITWFSNPAAAKFNAMVEYIKAEDVKEEATETTQPDETTDVTTEETTATETADLPDVNDASTEAAETTEATETTEAATDAETTVAPETTTDETTTATEETTGEPATVDVMTATGTSEIIQFGISKDSVLLNKVTLSGLEPGTEYRYRVGDGENWSEWRTFKTASETNNTFYVIGDTQMSGNAEADSEAIAMLETIAANLGEYDFGIQTGDFVDNGGKYANWQEILDVFGANFGERDLIHVMGNHEYFGDNSGDIAEGIFNMSDEDYYSVEYGNVYVAVINNSANLDKAAEWLKEDASASKCTYKVLTVHQPPYFTNAKGGSDGFNAKIPAMAQDAEIDIVFSGHDHSYARTEALRDGEIAEKDGIIYVICGDLGEKNRVADYEIATADIFKFAKATQDYKAAYLKAETTKTAMTVTAYDLDGTVIDTFTVASPCEKRGHINVYDPEIKAVVCTRCGEKAENYIGFAQDINGNTYYILNDEAITGWKTLLDDNGENCVYCFAEDGHSLEVEVKEGIPTTCTSRGHITYACKENGTEYTVKYGNAPGHEYVLQEDGSYKCSVCDYVRIEMKDCTITIPYSTYTYTGKAISPYPTVVDPNGRTLAGSSVDFYVSRRTNNVEVGYSTFDVVAKSGYLANLTEYRGNYGGVATVKFLIRPDAPTALTAESLTPSTATLKWTASKASGCQYAVYVSSNGGRTWKSLGTTEETEFTATALNPSTAYSFKVRAIAVVEDTDITSINYSNTASLSTIDAISISEFTAVLENTEWKYTGKAITPAATLTDANGNVLEANKDYTVSYSNNVAIGEASAVITGKGEYTGNITLTFSIVNTFDSVALNKKSITLGVGETYTLTPSVAPANGDIAPVHKWKTDNKKVAAVENGSVKAIAKGTATVTVTTQDGRTATCKITVKPAPTKVTLNKTKITLGVGETFDLESKVNSGAASYSRVYSSSDKSVATVKASGGLITAKAPGTTTVKVKTFNGKTATCTVTVKAAPTKITLNKTKITLGIGETFDLESKVNSGAASYSRVYSSSKSSVASVKSTGGLITAKKAGTTTITLKTYNGLTATCEVTVKPAPTSVKLNRKSVTLSVGGTYDLDSIVNSGSASYKRVFTSSDKSVATVSSQNGIVTAKKPGKVNITVETFNGKRAVCTVTVVK